MSPASCHQAVFRGHRSLHRLTLIGSLIVTLAAGLILPSPTLAAACGASSGLEAHAGLTSTQRSIVLLEGRDPANFPVTAGRLTLHAGMSPEDRSIVLIEGRDPGNFPATVATTGGLEARAGLSPSQRSIVLLEGTDPGNFPAAAVC